jgi:2-haloacid dehalogenase
MAGKRGPEIAAVKALTFDVFGTVVDWRGSVIREGQALGAMKGLKVDWAEFADAWRGLYQPAMSEVREGRRPYTKLDTLHRESLDKLIKEFGIKGLTEDETDHFNRAWHRLDPWPDSVAGLTRLRKKYPLATLSNGNVSLMMHMARRAGLPWDAILGAEPCRSYKPMPESYRRTAEFLSLPTPHCMLVAAHASDLEAASREGYRTAYVHRPLEFGPKGKPDEDTSAFDIVAKDFLDLADQLGC